MSGTTTPNEKVVATRTDKKNRGHLVDLSCSGSGFWSSNPEAVECEMSEMRLCSRARRCDVIHRSTTVFGVCSRISVDLQVIGRAVAKVVMIDLVQAIA